MCLIYMIWHKRLCNEGQDMACNCKSWTLRYFLRMDISCMLSFLFFLFGGVQGKNNKSLLCPPEFACKRGLLPELPFFRDIEKSEYSLKSVWIPECQCDGRNSRRYVCFMSSYQTYQIHMSIPLVGSVAFISLPNMHVASIVIRKYKKHIIDLKWYFSHNDVSCKRKWWRCLNL